MTPWQQAIHNIAAYPPPAYNHCTHCGAIIPWVAVNGKARKFCSEWCITQDMDAKKKERRRNARLANRSR